LIVYEFLGHFVAGHILTYVVLLIIKWWHITECN